MMLGNQKCIVLAQINEAFLLNLSIWLKLISNEILQNTKKNKIQMCMNTTPEKFTNIALNMTYQSVSQRKYAKYEEKEYLNMCL